MDTSMFWNVKQTLSHNMLINFIVGNRGSGKSFGAKQYAIDRFIKTGEQFGYIRRYKDDLKDTLPFLFDDIAYKYPDYEFKADSKICYIREKPADPDTKWTQNDIAGYGFYLSTADNKKSRPFPKITTLIFDEFLLDKGFQKYLDREPEKLLNLYETIARPGTDHPRVVLFLLANATTVTNPYFLYWNLKMPTKQDKNGKNIWKHPSRPILVEDVRNEKFINNKRNTEFGALVEGTSYAGYSIENKFLLDDDTFIEKRDPNARYYFTFTYQSHVLGVWVNMTAGLMYVSKAVDPSHPLNYAITMKDHSPNMLFLKNRQRAGHFKKFLEAYQLGAVRFEDMQIKNITYEVIRLAMAAK